MRRMTLGLGVAIGIAALRPAMLGTAQSATPKYGKCKPTGKYNSVALKTVKGDTLTVGYVTIAPARGRAIRRPPSTTATTTASRPTSHIAPASRRSCSGRSTSRSS